MRINHIKRTSHSPTDHTSNLTRKPKVHPKPPIPLHLARTPAEPIQPRTPQDQLRDDKHHAELRLVHAVVAAREQPRGPVGEQAAEQEPEECADEGARVHVACFDFAEPERRAQHDGCEHDAD